MRYGKQSKSKKKFVLLKLSKLSASLGHTASHPPHPTQAEKFIAGSGLSPTTIAKVGHIVSHLLHSLSTLKERTHRLASKLIKDIYLLFC